jgi:hypothetical protein
MTVNSDDSASLLAMYAPYPLHLLGWKSFQDLCVSIAEECLRRPVQNFLPTGDAGRDGAFVGRWDGEDPAAGESTIQCKFTSNPNQNLSVSLLGDEVEKARVLAQKGLADDYIILTNHPVTGASEIKIRAAFESAGVGRCRVFGADFINRQIKTSPRLRMMAPRLYGLGDLSDLLDARAYAQAQLILSAMGDDLQRLVVTDAHRRSVRAISEHSLVLLLGAPAAGKSTIGASLAVGAADIWQCGTIRATCPQDIHRHLNPASKQFFWIDDAWGSTQYQKQTVEEWNQVFPLMQGAMRKGTRFLITSRDYIWRAAQKDLKIQALPVLGKSQVVINVQSLNSNEKAQILYNHLKMGDQTQAFKRELKPFLSEIADLKEFLPESARRLSTRFFAEKLSPKRDSIVAFFKNPHSFLQETISNLSADCKAAIALIFLNGGSVRSPVNTHECVGAAEAFGVSMSALKDQLDALNGSLLLLAQDENGAYWTYKHPTVGDAFASYVAANPELVEVYLKGAKAGSILHEVVCAGITVYGAPVVIPDTLHDLLAERIKGAEQYALVSFLSYRSNSAFSTLMLSLRPDLLNRLRSFSTPIKDDIDASLIATLFEQGLLSEELRENFFFEVKRAATEEADASFLEEAGLRAILTKEEIDIVLDDVETCVIPKIDEFVDRLRGDWDPEYPPDDHFDNFVKSMELFTEALSVRRDFEATRNSVYGAVHSAISYMNQNWEPPSSTSSPTSSSTPSSTNLANIFRDIDE